MRERTRQVTSSWHPSKSAEIGGDFAPRSLEIPYTARDRTAHLSGGVRAMLQGGGGRVKQLVWFLCWDEWRQLYHKAGGAGPSQRKAESRQREAGSGSGGSSPAFSAPLGPAPGPYRGGR